MKITFLGTRGYIKAKTKLHGRHASTLITYKKKRIMIDCGLDWLGHIDEVNPDAIILTHAHPDHAWGLREGAPCPVYATEESWKIIKDYPIEDKRLVEIRKPFTLETLKIEAFDVIHSIRCPAVGYRITAGPVSIFCVHDVLYINDKDDALRGAHVYIGDGASIKIPMVRKRDDQLFGHAKIRTQLTWCKKEGVKRAFFTHCGMEIVGSNPEKIAKLIQALGKQRNVDATVAYDGLSIVIR